MSLMAKTRESTTLKMLLPMMVAVLVKFLFAGTSINGYEFADMSATEFASAETALFIIWLGREWRSAHYKNNA